MPKSRNINLIRLRSRNQITLPNALVERLEVEEGAYLAAVIDEDGTIRLRPATIAVAGTSEAERSMMRAEADIRAGRTEYFDSPQEFTAAMLAAHDEQISQLNQSSATMLVHVAPTATTISVQHHNQPVLSRALGVGSENSSRDDLAREIRKTFQLVESTTNITINGLFLSVANSAFDGFAERLRAELKIRVEQLSSLGHQSSGAAIAEPFFSSNDWQGVNVGKDLLSQVQAKS
jgi:antitoxin component of MazEF toxin-antitoxin module